MRLRSPRFLSIPKATILAVNEVAVHRLDKLNVNIIRRNINDVLSSDVAIQIKSIIDAVISLGEPIQFENESEGFLYANTIYPVFGRHGNIQKLAIYTRDVTVQRRAVEALRESEEKFRSISSSAQDALDNDEQQGKYFVIGMRLLKEFSGIQKKKPLTEIYTGYWFRKNTSKLSRKDSKVLRKPVGAAQLEKRLKCRRLERMERNFPWNFPCLLFNSRANGMLWELFEIFPIESRRKKNGCKRKNWKGYSRWPELPATN